MTTPQPAAGWYPDPTGGPGHLYWDGSSWHANLVPTGPPVAVPATPAALVSPASPRESEERRLSVAERNQILMQELAYRVNSGGVVGSVNTTTGTVSVRRTGPVVTKRGETWAEITYTARFTHPAAIVLRCMFVLMTCGFYLPFWVYFLGKKPKVYVLEVDEYGHKTSTQEGITTAQRIQRWVVVGAMLVWIYLGLQVIAAFQMASQGYQG